MQSPRKPPVAREITYHIGRKTGKIQVSPQGEPIPGKNAADSEPAGTGRLPAAERLIGRCWSAAPLPPKAVLSALLLAPAAAAALMGALLYALLN